MYYCDNCERSFYETEEIETTYEEYYGVSGMFPNSNSLSYGVCPHCGSEDYREVWEEDE